MVKKDFKDTNSIIISIKDGYQQGDELKVELDNVNYFWNSKGKTLQVEAKDSDNIANIINQVNLYGKGQEERFLDVKYSSQGEVIDLQEANITPSNIIKTNINEVIEEVGELNNNISSSIEIDFLDVDYQELDSIDFLDSFEEEALSFKVKKNDNLDGNIYQILKDSFSEGNEISLDYDVDKDKIDIEDFVREFGSSFSYDVIEGEKGLELQISSYDSQYNVLLNAPDVTSNSVDIDIVLQNIIINSDKS